MLEEVTTTDKSHHEKYFSLRLEDITHTNQEGMVRLKLNVFLEPCRFKTSILNNDIFSQRLHRINLLRASLLHELDLSKGAATNDWLDLEIGECHILLTVISCSLHLFAFLKSCSRGCLDSQFVLFDIFLFPNILLQCIHEIKYHSFRIFLLLLLPYLCSNLLLLESHRFFFILVQGSRIKLTFRCALIR